MKPTNLADYVGRTFILRKSKYGVLDGLTGTVTKVERVPWGTGEKDVLIVDVPTSDFSPAIMLPTQFASEVRS